MWTSTRVPPGYWAAALGGVVAALMPLIASPQVTLNEGQRAEAISLRGVAELSAKARIDLARTGEPLWHVVKDPGATLTKIVSDECGIQPEATQKFLVEQSMRLNVVDDLNRTFQPEDVVAVPFCLRIEEKAPVTVQPGDTPSEILKREYGVFGPLTTERFFHLNKSDKYPTPEAFAVGLRIGDELVVPFKADERIYHPLAPGSTSVEAVLATVPDRSVREQLSMSVAPVAADPGRERFRLRYVEPVEFTGVEPSQACNGTPGEVATIVDAALLRARFQVEQQARTDFFAAVPGGAGLLSATIGIVDSGLATIGDDFFAEKFFLPNINELTGIAGQDDNDNNLNDDIYGRNFYSPTEPGRVTPLPSAPRAAHGTKMGALALGGLNLAPNWNGEFDPPVVRLKVVSFTDGNPFNAEGTASPALLPEAIAYLDVEDVKVVNLSLVTDQRIVSLKNQIRDSKDLLFVVAAGNSSTGGGNDLRSFELYPARFGGDRGEPNVVTVAAHDLAGLRPDFSNFSKTHVDLLAPGCAVQTRTHETNVVLDNGTSPATAIVSFTAALVHALGVEKPSDIKMRLLAGTDFDPSLEEDAYASGRLNIIKAVSVFHDVVELNDGSPLLFGAVPDPKALLDVCEMPPAITTPVHKIIPNIGVAPDLELEFWTGIGDELVRNECEQSSGPFELTLAIDGVNQPIPITAVKEVIFGKHVSR